MTGSRVAVRWGLSFRARLMVWPITAGLAVWCMTGCSALNPAFVDLISPDGAGAATLQPAPGFVVIAFLNNAQVDEQLISFLEGPGGLVLTDLQKRALRPRIRARVRVTFTNGSVNEWEFVDGTQDLVDQRFAAIVEPDLNLNDLDNAVVQCDVARIELIQASIDVFIPVEIEVWEQVEVATGIGNQVTNLFVRRGQIQPAFRGLRMDDVDQDGNTILKRNIGIRDLPAPVISPICGTVVTISMNGTLAVPFLTGPGITTNNPSYDRGDAASEALIGGQYEFIVSQN